jgi:hypothetical protein
MRTGVAFRAAISLDSATGCQNLRRSLPIGVLGAVCVSRITLFASDACPDKTLLPDDPSIGKGCGVAAASSIPRADAGRHIVGGSRHHALVAEV